MAGFLSRKDYEAAYGDASPLLPGQLIEVLVKSAADKRSVRVSVSPQDLAAAVTKESETVNIASLLPGSLVNARIKVGALSRGCAAAG